MAVKAWRRSRAPGARPEARRPPQESGVCFSAPLSPRLQRDLVVLTWLERREELFERMQVLVAVDDDLLFEAVSAMCDVLRALDDVMAEVLAESSVPCTHATCARYGARVLFGAVHAVAEWLLVSADVLTAPEGGPAACLRHAYADVDPALRAVGASTEALCASLAARATGAAMIGLLRAVTLLRACLRDLVHEQHGEGVRSRCSPPSTVFTGEHTRGVTRSRSRAEAAREARAAAERGVAYRTVGHMRCWVAREWGSGAAHAGRRAAPLSRPPSRRRHAPAFPPLLVLRMAARRMPYRLRRGAAKQRTGERRSPRRRRGR